MPLTNKDIVAINQAITNKGLLSVRTKKSFEPNGTHAGKTTDFSGANTFEELADSLLNARNTSLERRSSVINVTGKDIRIFPPRENSVQTDKFDAYARGLDFARGALEIVKNAGLDKEEEQNIINRIKESLATCAVSVDEAKNEEKAQKAVLKLNAELAMALKDANIIPTDKQAITAIRFASDYVMQRDINNLPTCSVLSLDGEGTKLSIEEPLRFNERDSSPSEQVWDWADAKKPAWYENLEVEVGNRPWLSTMMAAEKETMRTLPTTSMTRFTPNAPNATVTTDVFLNAEDKIQSQSKDYGVAITEPLEVGANNAEARIAIAAQAHQQMVMNRLESNIEEYIERWGSLLGKDGEIDFTVLHQTLVGDGFKGEDQKKAKRPEGDSTNMIDTKAEANEELRKYLADKTVFVNSDNKVSVLKGKDKEIPVGARKVNVDVLETNNCINMHEAKSRIRNSDIEASAKLVSNTTDLFNKLESNDESLEADIEIVKAALNTDNNKLTDYSPDEKMAMGRVCNALFNEPGKFKDIGQQQGKDLSLLIQATAELKRTLNPNIKPKSGLERKSHAKAKYEGIVAQLQGQMMGGCMSSCDRRNEMTASRAAVKAQHALTGTIVRYDSLENRDDYVKHLDTQAKHNNVEMATGAPGTKDGETIGVRQVGRKAILKGCAKIPLIGKPLGRFINFIVRISASDNGMASSLKETPDQLDQSGVSAGLRKPKAKKIMKMVDDARKPSMLERLKNFFSGKKDSTVASEVTSDKSNRATVDTSSQNVTENSYSKVVPATQRDHIPSRQSVDSSPSFTAGSSTADKDLKTLANPPKFEPTLAPIPEEREEADNDLNQAPEPEPDTSLRI